MSTSAHTLGLESKWLRFALKKRNASRQEGENAFWPKGRIGAGITTSVVMPDATKKYAPRKTTKKKAIHWKALRRAVALATGQVAAFHRHRNSRRASWKALSQAKPLALGRGPGRVRHPRHLLLQTSHCRLNALWGNSYAKGTSSLRGQFMSVLKRPSTSRPVWQHEAGERRTWASNPWKGEPHCISAASLVFAGRCRRRRRICRTCDASATRKLPC